MRTIRRIFIFSTLTLLFLVITTGILAWIFEDELTRYAVEGLNQKIRTEARVGNIRLRFLRKFPDASLEFNDVILYAVSEDEATEDTLLQAERIYLQFNVLEVFRQEYKVRQVSVQSGRLHLGVDEDGNDNYTFWIPKEEKTDDPFLLDLETVSLSDIDLEYRNQALELAIAASIRHCSFSGQFARQEYHLSTGIRGSVREYARQGKSLLRNQDLRLSATLHVDPMAIQIDEGSISSAGQNLMIEGRFLRPKPFELQLQVKGSAIDMERLRGYSHLLPKGFRKDFEVQGILDFEGRIRGFASKTRLPEIQADFSIHQGWLKLPALHAPIRELHVQGHYQNGKERSPASSEIRLENTTFRFGKSRIGGDLRIKDFNQLRFDHDLKFALALEDIAPYVRKEEVLDSLQGFVQGELAVDGAPPDVRKFRPADLLAFDIDARLRFDSVDFYLPARNLAFRSFSGEMDYKEHVKFRHVSGRIKEGQVSFSGRADNLLEYLLTPDANLWADLDIYSEKLDMSYLFGEKKQQLGKSRRDSFRLPERLYAKSRFWIDELEMLPFRASQVTGVFSYRPGRMDVPSLNLQSMDGMIIAKGSFEQQSDRFYMFNTTAQLEGINIRKAFSSFNNFGQDFIQEPHIRGTLNGKVEFYSRFDPLMKIRKESMLADCDISIRNGELRQFEPMMKLSRFIEVEELENVQFSELNNQIFIRQQEVIIPQMDIISSAFDITASGRHGFDRNFEYKLKVSLSDILAKKKRGQTASEFGIIEDDGLGRMFVFLIIEGTGRETNVRYDRRGALNNLGEEIREEKQELKEILNREFGWFKRDTTLEREVQEGDSPGFLLEWDEEADSASIEPSRPAVDTGGRKFRIIWDEEDRAASGDATGKQKKRTK